MTIEGFFNDVGASVKGLFNSEIHTKFADLPELTEARIIVKTLAVAFAVGIIAGLAAPVAGLIFFVVGGVGAFSYFTHTSRGSFAGWELPKILSDIYADDLIKQHTFADLVIEDKYGEAFEVLFNIPVVEDCWNKGKYFDAVQALMP